ncbi:MAG: [FeFe] hydrogenase H-cluster radical SAM maturase HydE [Candidatus Krumholzibacteriia bacterium]
MDALERILTRERLEEADLVTLLSLEEPGDLQRLYEAAYAVKVREVGRVVYLRGLVEVTNVCSRDCLYCGIRRSNDEVERYLIDADEVLAAARWGWDQGFGSAVLQGGERTDPRFVAYIEEIVRAMQGFGAGGIGVTLSLGEQTEATYRRWHAAGAQRYLLRIETTNRELFAAIHADDQSFDERLDCLASLRACGYQVGTGVMIGLPGQTAADLARDIIFMRDQDIDMVGMGPFIPHQDTPMADSLGPFAAVRERQLELGLTMIACTRLALRDVNIASTTALQALGPDGRERGLLAGANILMPNLTHTRFRRGYQLYDGKPGLDEGSEASTRALERSVAAIGETVGYRELGTSPHFTRRTSAP